MTKSKALEMLNRLSLKKFLILLVAGCINAFGVNIFLAPVNLYDSGIPVRLSFYHSLHRIIFLFQFS
jgi:uncharacterized membrane-anchored protein YitT (DUF2179 family)